MELRTLLLKIIISVLYGIIVGVVTIPVSKKLSSVRTEDPAKLAPLLKTSVRLLIVTLAVISSVGITMTTDFSQWDSVALALRNLLFLIPIFSIATIDSLVRKIPNSLLLGMIAIEVVYLVDICVVNKSAEALPSAFVGFFIGMVVCTIPSLLKIPMGAGDIKYNGVIGLSIGAVGYFQSMILMAIFVAIFALVLKITKKGGMKTLIPMGPFISMGMVISLCFPFADIIQLF